MKLQANILVTLDLPPWRGLTFFCPHYCGSHNSRTWTRFQSFACLFQVNGWQC